jgi:putative ABC transport system permease protein
MLNLRFLLREMLEARKQAGIFILCVALSITTLVALNSFRRDVNTSIIGDARALHGGDLILHSHYEFSPGLITAVNRMGNDLQGRVRSWEFYSVVRNPADEETLFSNIKAVGPSYPLYGEVELLSGADFQEVLQPGTIVVAGELLEKLGLKVGDFLYIGKATLRIGGVVVRESTRPVDLFNFGPRVFVAAADLDKLDLVKTGSRVEYEMLLKMASEDKLEQAAELLSSVAMPGQERVATYETARSGLKRFFDNLLFFLSLISIFTLLLAGIGMQSSLSALLRQKEKSLAITKALGATQKFLLLHYLLLVLIYGLVGGSLGILTGAIMKYLFPLLFVGLIPPESMGGLGAADIAEGLIIGFLVVCFFTFLPLYRLRDVKPNVIFRSEKVTAGKEIIYYLAIGVGLILLTLLVIRQLEDVKIGIYFMAGTIGLIVLISVLARLLLAGFKRLKIRSLPLRQAFRSLLRPGNSTRAVIVTLASALSVLLAIFLVEYNLHTTYVESYPKDAPNLFLVDIQSDQRQGFEKLMGVDVQLHPIIRARLKAINDIPVKRGQQKNRWSDSLSREFNLTYRNELLADEVVIDGGTLYQQDLKGDIYLQVSILDMVAEMGDMKIGDVLDFNIQGVELKAKITSVRTRNKSMLYPFFYFVFPEEFLLKAPQTLFAAVHVESSTIPEVEKKVVAAYPNISVINMAKTAEELGVVMKKLSGIVNFFALFSIFAGGLIIISSILATRLARIREAVYYKVLGARSSFVFLVFFYENMLLGLLSSVLGVLLAQAGSWALCHFLFKIIYNPNWFASGVLVLFTLLLVVTVGMTSSISIIRQKPIFFLREQTLE